MLVDECCGKCFLINCELYNDVFMYNVFWNKFLVV